MTTEINFGYGLRQVLKTGEQATFVDREGNTTVIIDWSNTPYSPSAHITQTNGKLPKTHESFQVVAEGQIFFGNDDMILPHPIRSVIYSSQK